jgi:hypothetical protein
MTLEGIAVGLLALAVGAAFTFWGFRFFLILLPIWGFFAGFIFGANGISYLLGDGFLATTLGWVVGFVLGIVFAILSYLYYWVAVVLLGAAVGYAAGIGLMHWLGNGGGLLAFSVGVIGAVILAGLVIVLRVPKYLVVVLTAFGGAFTAVYGVALIFNVVPLKDTTSGNVDQAGGGILGSFAQANLGALWVVAAVVLGAVGLLYQMRTTTEIESLAVDAYQNPGMPSSSSPY